MFGNGMTENMMIDDLTFFLGSIQDEYDVDLLDIPVLVLKEILSDEDLRRFEKIVEG